MYSMSEENVKMIHVFGKAIIRPKAYNWEKHLKTNLFSVFCCQD